MSTAERNSSARFRHSDRVRKAVTCVLSVKHWTLTQPCSDIDTYIRCTNTYIHTQMHETHTYIHTYNTHMYIHTHMDFEHVLFQVLLRSPPHTTTMTLRSVADINSKWRQSWPRMEHWSTFRKSSGYLTSYFVTLFCYIIGKRLS